MTQNKLERYLKDLKKIDIQRKAWLALSALAVISIGFIIFDTTKLESIHILWTVGSIGIVLSVFWWYWAMRVIDKVVSHRTEELEVLSELCETVKDLKEDIRKTYVKNVD